MELVDDCQQFVRDYNLTPFQKLKYLHKILSGDEKRCCLDRIDGIATGSAQAVDMIENKYNSTVRQNTTKTFLSKFSVSRYFSTVMEGTEALQKVRKEITRMARQMPLSHREDAHRAGFYTKPLLNTIRLKSLSSKLQRTVCVPNKSTPSLKKNRKPKQKAKLLA